MIFPKRDKVYVIAIALHANGTSSYRDANSIVKIAKERWNAETVIITDNPRLVNGECVGITKKEDFLEKIEECVKTHSKSHDLLFTLSAHGYSCGRFQYIKVKGGNIFDTEIRDAFYKYVDKSCLSLALIDTCHSGTMFDLPLMSSDGEVFRKMMSSSLDCESYCISACNDNELAGEDISDYGGWGGKLISLFLDYVKDKIDIMKFYKYTYKTFTSQSVQRSHPVLSMTSGD